MKKLSLVFFAVLSSATLYGQDTTVVQSSSIASGFSSPTLSSKPTLSEVVAEFQSQSSQSVMGAAESMVSSKGDSAVDALVELIDSDSISTSMQATDTGTASVPFLQWKIMAISTLGEIGTPTAFSALLQVGYAPNRTELSGLTLQILTTTYYERVLKGDVAPDSKVLGILFSAADDPSYVWFLHKKVEDIAYLGLMNWLGMDFGEPQFREARLKAGGSSGELSPEAYSQLWWKQNSANMVWNKETSHFEVGR